MGAEGGQQLQHRDGERQPCAAHGSDKHALVGGALGDGEASRLLSTPADHRRDGLPACPKLDCSRQVSGGLLAPKGPPPPRSAPAPAGAGRHPGRLPRSRPIPLGMDADTASWRHPCRSDHGAGNRHTSSRTLVQVLEAQPTMKDHHHECDTFAAAGRRR